LESKVNGLAGKICHQLKWHRSSHSQAINRGEVA
jgi:hypothetical protein